MNSEELCRKCRHPAKDYASNMTRDKYGEWIRCSRCVEMKREVDLQRAEWNRRVVALVQKLDPELQDYYKYDLARGTLRAYLFNMRETGRSPGDAVRAWRHKVMYLDATQATRNTTRQRSKSSQFQVKLDTVPQRQYRQPSEMPLVIARSLDVITTRPLLPVIFAPPTQIVNMSNSLQRTYFPTYSSESDDSSDTTSESSDASFRGRVSGIVRDHKGRMAVVVTDSRGNKAKGRSVLTYFAT